MSFEDQTQRLRVGPATTHDPAADTTTALPGPLDLAGPAPAAPDAAPVTTPGPAGDTDVLSLDELFDAPPAPAEPPAQAPPSAAEAPTWTAMPVVAVRSEPISRPPTPPAAPERKQRSELSRRVRSDAAAAWDGTRQRTRDWLGRDDHALMIMTALVAIVLIIVVAALGA